MLASRVPSARTLALTLSLLGAAASFTLVLGHIQHAAPPGCGLGSPCAQAAASPWSKIPVLEIPVAGVSFAYFLMAWCLTLAKPASAAKPRSGMPRSGWFLWPARFAALTSLFYLVLSASLGLWCPYCLVCHACSIGLWLVFERAKGAGPAPKRVAVAGAIGAASLLVIAGLSMRTRAARAEALAQEAAAAEAKLRSTPTPTRTLTPTLSAAEPVSTSDPSAPRSSLAGRYPLGAADAPIEVVVFTGYQCPDCRRLEKAIASILASRRDVRLSIRHFPFCADCNRLATSTIHPNACWAARAAEAAGQLGGPEAFWAMHRWLFSRGGAFTDAQLGEHLRETAFAPDQFVALLQSNATLAPVRDDVEIAASLALNRTPTLFINNVEFRAWEAPGALASALDAASAGAAQTKPLAASDRLLAEWLEQPVKPMPVDATPRTLGAAEAPVQIVVFGDYQDDGTAAIDKRCRQLAASDPRVRYTFRHFPADQKCNPTVPRSFHPLACRFARTAEAAGAIAGPDAFWNAHAWILAHHRAYTDADFRAHGESQGWDVASILRARDAQAAAVEDDVRAGAALGVTELPWIIVNGKRAPRWKTDSGDVLDAIVDRAAQP